MFDFLALDFLAHFHSARFDRDNLLSLRYAILK